MTFTWVLIALLGVTWILVVLLMFRISRLLFMLSDLNQLISDMINAGVSSEALHLAAAHMKRMKK